MDVDRQRPAGSSPIATRVAASLVVWLTALSSFGLGATLLALAALSSFSDVARSAPAFGDMSNGVAAPISLLFVTALVAIVGTFRRSGVYPTAAFLASLVAVCLLMRTPEVIPSWSELWTIPTLAFITLVRRLAEMTSTWTTGLRVVVVTAGTSLALSAVVVLHTGLWPTAWSSDHERLQKFFTEHRGEFADTARFAAQSSSAIKRGHVRLPMGLCNISADCLVTDTATNPPASSTDDSASQLPVVPFIATTIYRDSETGFGHFDEPPQSPPNGFRDGRCPRYEVGDGWWFMDYPGDGNPRTACAHEQAR